MFKNVVKEEITVPAQMGYLRQVRDFIEQIGKKYRYSDKVINSDEARQFCVLFLRSAESFGTPRNINDRDVETMSRWIRDGLDREQWCKILDDHWQYCRKNLRDYARGIGYFQVPVSKVLGRSDNYKVNDVLKSAVRSTRT